MSPLVRIFALAVSLPLVLQPAMAAEPTDEAGEGVLVLHNGHVLRDGLGFQVSKGEHGNRVNEMLVNYQMKEFGGGAWLRRLEFLPDGRTVQARTYSPLYEQYATDPQNQFRFEID